MWAGRAMGEGFAGQLPEVCEVEQRAQRDEQDKSQVPTRPVAVAQDLDRHRDGDELYHT